MSRKILISGLSILASLGLVTAATFAFFSDVGASNDNVFASGTLDLNLSNNGTDFTTGNVTATWGDSDMGPGDFTPLGVLTMKNTGSVPANHVDFNFTNTNSDSSFPLDAVMRITTLMYDSTDLLSGLGASPNTYGLVDTDSSGYLELDELAAQDLDVHNLPFTELAPTTHTLSMQLQMSTGATNDYQGDNVSTNVEATLNQGPTD